MNSRSLAKQKRASLSSIRKTADKPKDKIEGGEKEGKKGAKKKKESNATPRGSALANKFTKIA